MVNYEIINHTLKDQLQEMTSMKPSTIFLTMFSQTCEVLQSSDYLYAVWVHDFTSVCWWKWQQSPQDTVQKQILKHTLRFHMTVGSGGSETGMSNSARNDWTWPEPAQLKVTWWSVNWQAVRHCNRYKMQTWLTASWACIRTLKSLTGREPRYRVRVSDRSPVTGSKTVRSNTPF